MDAGCFHVSAIVNSAVTNIGVYVSFWITVLSGYMRKNGTAISYGNSIFNFEIPPYCAAPIYIPATNNISSVQSLSCVQLFLNPWITAYQASVSITNSRSLPKPMFIESVIPSNCLIVCRPLLRLPSIFPSIRVFPNCTLISPQSLLHSSKHTGWEKLYNE